ncbi:outer membrane protein assembly factor BamB [Cardiobacteriaceae bacterium TAE3-ERU3]|nr:outer membrane protein assembly factor BamB [Cardiobacteriaceae bacterium TAE3-ERU3]
MRISVLPLMVCAALMSACSPANFFLGEDNRPAAKPLPAIDASLQTAVLWSDSLGEGGDTASLALAPDGSADTVYAISADGILAAYDLRSGSKKFSRDLDLEITAGVRYGNGQLFAATRNGELLALNSSDGSITWRTNVGGAVLARPALAGDMVIVRTGEGSIYAYSTTDGTQRWQYRIGEPQLSVRGYAEPVVGGGVVIITTDSGRLIVLDQASGFPVAEQRVAVGEGYNDIQRLVDIDATPKINQGIMFGSAYQANTFAVDLQSGQVVWSQPQVSTADDFAMSPDALFLHDGIDHIYAINQRDGDIRWHNDQLEGRYLSPMVAIPGRVGSVDGEGYLHWLNINNGNLIGQTRIGDTNALGAPYIGQSAIVWQLADGDVVAVQPQ